MGGERPKRHRDTPKDDDAPIPPPEQATNLAVACESAINGTDLADLRDAQLLHWLRAAPGWVDWSLGAAEASKAAAVSLSARSTPAHGMTAAVPSASLFPPSPVGSTATPNGGAFPASPSLAIARPTRPRSYDSSGTLVSIAAALSTIPWGRPRSRTRVEEMSAAFEAACVKVLTADTSGVTTVPVVEAALQSVLLDDVGPVLVSMGACGLLTEGNEEAEKHSSSAVDTAGDKFGQQSRREGAIDVVARIINQVAVHHPPKIAEVLSSAVAKHFPGPRWPVLAQFEDYIDLLLLLAGVPRVPKGCAPVPGASRPIGETPPPSPQVDAQQGTTGGKSPAAGSTQSLVPFVVSEHRALLVDTVLKKLVAMDNALSTDPRDASAVKRLRRVVGRTAAIIRRTLVETASGEEELWLQPLLTFHQQSVMNVTDTKAVHMLVPLLVSGLESHHVSGFLHSCISHVEKLPPSGVQLKTTAAAHLAPLLGILGPAFAKRDSTEADSQLCGIVRRVAKLTAKVVGKNNVAGNDRFSEALFGVLRAVAEHFECSAGGRGDVSDEILDSLKKRHKEAPAKIAREGASHVNKLFDASMSHVGDFGGKVTSPLRHFRKIKVRVTFD